MLLLLPSTSAADHFETWQVAHLFSAFLVRLSIDQKANLKSNSDHNDAEGGNRKQYVVDGERT